MVDTPHTPDDFDYSELEHTLQLASSESAFYHYVVNAPFAQALPTAKLFLGVIVLLLVNEKQGMIDRIAITNNDIASRTKAKSVKKFEDIRIPLDNTDNIIAEAMRSQTPQVTTDWQNLFTPDLTPDAARINQSAGGIGCSVAFPITGSDRRGALIFSYYQTHVGQQHHAFMRRYADIVARYLS